MCVIVICPDRKPTYDQIHKMYEDNSHGASISWFNEKGKAQYVKGLNKQKIFKKVYELPLPFVLHFRESSFIDNRDNKFLNHPFEITVESELRLEGEADKLLIHNGTIREYELMMAVANLPFTSIDKKDMSDTRGIAMIMAKMNDDKLPWRIPGKFVILDAIKHKFRLTGEFTTEDGMMFSNMSWVNRGSYSKWWHEGMDDDEIYNTIVNDEKKIAAAALIAHESKTSLMEPPKEAQKKKIVLSYPEFKPKQKGKKKTEEIESKIGTNEQLSIKLDVNMSECQYCAAGFYKPPETEIQQRNNPDNGISTLDKYAHDGLKERRRWWHGEFPKLEKNQKYNNYLTPYPCMKCAQNLSFYRVRVLNEVGYKPWQYLCVNCKTLSGQKPNKKVIIETGLMDNFRAKSTRILGNFSPCLMPETA